MHNRIPLLLVPGLSSTRLLWQKQIDALEDVADCWVSPLPAHEDLGAIADEILADAPPFFALAGYSMGGYICFEMYRRAPHRILRLGLFATTPYPERPAMARRRHMMIKKSETGYLAMWREVLPRFVAPSRSGDTVFLERMARMAYEGGATTFRAHQKAAAKRRSHEDLLPRITCPTLVMVGANDALTSVDEHRDFAARIPDAEMTVIPDAGHLAPLEQPDATTAAMRQWLTREPMALAA
ncbi:MAG: alpha/beta fold hydrolase [Alphaproteobacteria bacterium]|jgi:pimeloyl-ACP methyl ester carboxylesterase|nr:alpha/beta fold hydrolase [Alphaproteobacteria bacterium]